MNKGLKTEERQSGKPQHSVAKNNIARKLHNQPKTFCKRVVNLQSIIQSVLEMYLVQFMKDEIWCHLSLC